MTREDYLSVGRNADGSPLWRVSVLSTLARVMGVQFHVGGWPYGADYQRSVNRHPYAVETCESGA